TGRRTVAVAAVGQQQGFEIGGGGTHQGRAVRDDVRHDVLVRQDYAVRRFRQAQGPYDAALQQAVVLLLVDVQAGLGVGRQDAFGQPAAQRVRRLLVAGGGRGGLGEYQPDDVVRVGGFQVEQAVRAYDDVVRRGGHRRQAADAVGVVAQATERGQFQAAAHRCLVLG